MKKIIVELESKYKMIDNCIKSQDKCTGCVFFESKDNEDKSILCDNSDICFVLNGIWKEVK